MLSHGFQLRLEIPIVGDLLRLLVHVSRVIQLLACFRCIRRFNLRSSIGRLLTVRLVVEALSLDWPVDLPLDARIWSRWLMAVAYRCVFTLTALVMMAYQLLLLLLFLAR